MKKITKTLLMLAATFFSVASFASQSERNEIPTISMYPNPTVSNVNIVSEKVMKRVEVRTRNGNVVMETYPNATSVNLDVSNLEKGRYIVTIYNDIAYQIETIMVH